MEPNTLIQETEIPEDGVLNLKNQFVIFTINEQKFALPATVVSRIVRIVEITPIPNAPANIVGVINVQGEAVPVFNMRKLFGFPDRELKLTDQLIIARISGHTISFITDMVTGITNRLDKKIITADKIFPGLEKIIEGLVFFEDGMILIYDMGKLFTMENREVLDLVMNKAEEKIKDKKGKFKVKEKTEARVKDVIQEEVKKAVRPKVVRTKRVKANGKKTVRTVAKKPKGRAGSK